MNLFAATFRYVIRRCIFLLAVTFTISTLVHAENATIPDPEALHSRVAEFNKAFAAVDLQTVFSMFPPRIFGEAAKQHGTTVQAAIDMATKDIGAQMAKEARMISYAIDDAHPRIVTLDGGKEGIVLPVVDVRYLLEKNKKMEFKSEVVALQEDGKWYLLPLNVKWEIMALFDSYPEYRGMKIQASSTELKD